MRRTESYTKLDHQRNEDILPELGLEPTESSSSKYNARLQTAVARGLIAYSRVSGPSDCRCFQTFTVLFQFIFRVDGHAHRRTFAKRKHYRLLIVIIVRRQCCKCSYCDYCDL